MSFAGASRTIYKPIRVLFGTPIYERALRLCWHSPSYKSMIALMTQLLRLQQNNQLPAEVTAANMSELLVEQSKETLRVQLWEFELEGYDDDVRPLLQLVWEVNNAMKMRDVEYEARRLLSSPEAVPPRFQHPNIISQALEYAVILKEQQEKGPRSELLSPMEVVLQVLPKVLQGFWVPPPNTCFSMPSQQLSPMAVGITKAVQDRVSKTLSTVLLQATFSSTTRDNMTLSIQEKVRQGYSQDVLEKGLNSFAAEVLNTITDVAVREVCALFQPLISEAVETATDEPPASPEPDSAVGSTPCALTVTDEPPASPEPDSAVGSTPCALTVTDEPQKPVYSFVNYNYNAEARGTNSTENEAPGLQENREMISAIITTPPALSAHTAIQNVFNRSLGETDRHEESESVEVSTLSAVKKSKFRGFLNWLKKHCCCCLLSGDNEVD